MRVCLIGLALTTLLVVTDAQAGRYDVLRVDEVLANKRLLNAYIKCVLEQGKCTPEGRELKSRISDALKNGCNKCSDTQRQSIRKVIGHLMNNEQEKWKELVQMYDSEGVYARKYEKELKTV